MCGANVRGNFVPALCETYVYLCADVVKVKGWQVDRLIRADAGICPTGSEHALRKTGIV
jgi:hypothetical protein